MNHRDYMTEDNAHAVALGLYGLWSGARIVVCLGLAVSSQDGIVWAVIAWMVLGLARPSA